MNNDMTSIEAQVSDADLGLIEVATPFPKKALSVEHDMANADRLRRNYPVVVINVAIIDVEDALNSAKCV